MIQQLTNNNAGDINVGSSMTCQHPIVKSTVEAIPRIKTTESMVQLESVIICANLGNILLSK